MSNSTGNRAIRDVTIEIARGEAECYFNCFTSAIDSTGNPCYHSLIVDVSKVNALRVRTYPYYFT